jgi:hypothetical protein
MHRGDLGASIDQRHAQIDRQRLVASQGARYRLGLIPYGTVAAVRRVDSGHRSLEHEEPNLRATAPSAATFRRDSGVSCN